jgi:hypothetical protein
MPLDIDVHEAINARDGIRVKVHQFFIVDGASVKRKKRLLGTIVRELSERGTPR